MLVTGQRLADGGVLARAVFFEAAKTMVPVPLTVRSDSTQIEVIGSFNSENTFIDRASGKERSLLSATGRGYYVLGLIAPAHEPTAHALGEIAAAAEEFDRLGMKLVLLFADAGQADRFRSPLSGSLPANTVLGCDINGVISGELGENLKIDTADKPVFVIADTFNRVLFCSHGYTIGLGDRLVDTLNRLVE